MKSEGIKNKRIKSTRHSNTSLKLYHKQYEYTTAILLNIQQHTIIMLQPYQNHTTIYNTI